MPSAEIQRYNDDNYVNNQPSSMEQAAAVDKIVVGSYIYISILFFLCFKVNEVNCISDTLEDSTYISNSYSLTEEIMIRHITNRKEGRCFWSLVWRNHRTKAGFRHCCYTSHIGHCALKMTPWVLTHIEIRALMYLVCVSRMQVKTELP